MKEYEKYFSFIIPVYNVSTEQIMRCVDSIVKQGLNNYEIIIVDDGSTDLELKRTLTNLEAENKFVNVLYQENQGSAVARNTALDVAHGEYVVFVDADDYLLPNSIMSLSCDKRDADIFCLDYVMKTGEVENLCTLKEEIDFSTDKSVLLKNVLYTPNALNDLMFGAIWAKCFSRAFLEKKRIRFCPELRKTQDRVFMLDAYNEAQAIIYKPIPVYVYETNVNSITHRMNLKLLDYCHSVVETVKIRCNEYHISKTYSRFFVYSVVVEMLMLTLLNAQYEKPFLYYRNEMRRVYRRYDLDKELEALHYSDIISLKGKMKLYLFKHHMFGLLRLYFAGRIF